MISQGSNIMNIKDKKCEYEFNGICFWVKCIYLSQCDYENRNSDINIS